MTDKLVVHKLCIDEFCLDLPEIIDWQGDYSTLNAWLIVCGWTFRLVHAPAHR